TDEPLGSGRPVVIISQGLLFTRRIKTVCARSGTYAVRALFAAETIIVSGSPESTAIPLNMSKDQDHHSLSPMFDHHHDFLQIHHQPPRKYDLLLCLSWLVCDNHIAILIYDLPMFDHNHCFS